MRGAYVGQEELCGLADPEMRLVLQGFRVFGFRDFGFQGFGVWGHGPYMTI